MAEIGSYVGASACCFGAAISANRDEVLSNVFCIDTWNNDAMSEGARDTWSEFSENTSDYINLLIPVRGFSTEVVGEIRQHTERLDLLFIDGDHSYEGVKADWLAYREFMGEGSVIVFHDFGWAEGVQRVVREDVSPLVVETGCLPNMWWGVLGDSL